MGNPHIDSSGPGEARRALERAQEERARRVSALDMARERMEAAVRAFGPDHERSQAAQRSYKQALGALVQARGTEKRLRAELHRRLEIFLPPTMAEEVARLDGGTPILLFPVRLETRFRAEQDGHGGELLVRIYPDSIVGDNHEPLLDETEVAAGQAYWRQAWDADGEAGAWTVLVSQHDAPRAAWIVHETEPLNLDARPEGEPDFPVLEMRPKQWRRENQAHILPDRWLVLGYRGGTEVVRAVSGPVQQPLTLTVSLSSDGPEPELDDAIDLSGDGLEVDPEIRWTFDFEAALAAGMAVRVPLDATSQAAGFDRLVVVGVRASADPETAGAELAALLDAHHYTRGLAFVPQGTATNNTSGEPSGYPPPDLDGVLSYAVERNAEPLPDDSDGARFTRALGLPAQAAAHLASADGGEERRARAMAEALWPATLEYFLEQMMAPVVSRDAVDAAHDYFVDWVRGRGPYPAFRVGDVPYGLLPVSSPTAWQPARGAKGADVTLPPLLRLGFEGWRQQAGLVPRVNRTNDADGDLMEALAMDASARQVRIRSLLGRETQWNLFGLFGIPMPDWDDFQRAVARNVLAAIGHPEWDPRVVWMAFSDRANLYRFGLVTAGPVSEVEGLAFDYINWIRTAPAADLRAEAVPAGAERPRALLYRMLRLAMLAKLGRTAKGILLQRKLVTDAVAREAELVGIAPAPAAEAQEAAPPTVWQMLDRQVPALTGAATLGEYLAQPVGTVIDPERQPIAKYREALQTLEGLPTAELERLFSETLDVNSHRTDAWITSQVTRRLEAMREARPTGVHLGSFGWVEDLRPDPPGRRREVRTPDGRPAMALTDSGGYVYAPSMLHAATAALLRSAYQTRSGEHQEPYAVDLSSARVRMALWLLDTVRDGQPLGAALGYRFERGLHEGHAPLELDKFIDDFRRLFPLVANKSGATSGPSESVAARNVVDGLLLRRAWQENRIPWETGDFTPTPSGAERTAIEAELRALDDAVDAVADLLLAESVYQVVRGSMAGAGASLDTAGRGVRPPEPELAQTPRGGTTVYQRVVAVLGGDPVAGGAWHTPPATPRGRAEPVLNAWAGSLLGDPAAALCVARFPDPAAPETTLAQPVSLADLAIEPLDFLALAAAAEAGAEQGDAEIDRRAAASVAGLAAEDARIEIEYAPEGLGAGQRTWAEMLALAREINALVAAARPLAPQDLLPPEDAGHASEAVMEAMAPRANAALLELETALSALEGAVAAVRAAPEGTDPDLGALRAALAGAALFGLSGAFPASSRGNGPEQRTALLEQGDSVVAELRGRRTAAQGAADGVAALKATFGAGFVAVPRFRPALPEVLGPALAGGAGLGATPREVRSWQAQAARVRAGVGAWRRLALVAGAHGHPLPGAAVAQLPHAPGARWAALPFATPEERPRDGLVSLVMYRAAAPDADELWAGLLVDEWAEKIPSEEEDAAVVFHYDSPGAQAPQALLLAVPPVLRETWDLDTLIRILHETLDLAKVRAVDGELLGLYGQLIPAIYLAANPADDAVSTLFAGQVMAEAQIAKREG